MYGFGLSPKITYKLRRRLPSEERSEGSCEFSAAKCWHKSGNDYGGQYALSSKSCYFAKHLPRLRLLQSKSRLKEASSLGVPKARRDCYVRRRWCKRFSSLGLVRYWGCFGSNSRYHSKCCFYCLHEKLTRRRSQCNFDFKGYLAENFI